MAFSQDEIEELKKLFPGASHATEGGAELFLLPQLALPSGCTPERVDALLCATPRDGYTSRLFFSQMISGPIQPNWNKQNELILDRRWFAYSFQTPLGLRLAQMIASHLKGIK